MTPWTAAHLASMSITNPRSLLKLMSIELVMPSSNLSLCCPLLLLPPITPGIRVLSSSSLQVAKALSMLSKEPVVFRYNLKDSIPKFKCLPYYFHTYSLWKTSPPLKASVSSPINCNNPYLMGLSLNRTVYLTE